MRINHYLINLFLVMLTILITPVKGAAAEIHALLAGDGTEDMGNGIDLMFREVKRIAAHTHLKSNVTILEGYQGMGINILKHIEEMKVNPDDILIVYLNFHGSRLSSKESQWPDLHTLYPEYLDFDYINEILKNKQPHFLLSIAESCNNIRSEKDDDEEENDEDSGEQLKQLNDFYSKMKVQQIVLDDSDPYILYISNQSDEEDKEFYSELFLKKSGSILISSSIPGQSAIKDPIIGGWFTVSFLKAMFDAISYDKDANWEKILEDASSKTINIVSQKGFTETRPQYQLNLN